MSCRGPHCRLCTVVSPAWVQLCSLALGARSGTATRSLHTENIHDQRKSAWVGPCPDVLLPPYLSGAVGRDGTAMGSYGDRDRPSAGRTAHGLWLPGEPARPSRRPGHRCAHYGGPSSEAGGRTVLSPGWGDTGWRVISSTTGKGCDGKPY